MVAFWWKSSTSVLILKGSPWPTSFIQTEQREAGEVDIMKSVHSPATKKQLDKFPVHIQRMLQLSMM